MTDDDRKKRRRSLSELATDFDGPFWNVGHRRRSRTPADETPTLAKKIEKPERKKRVPLWKTLLSELDGDYWTSTSAERAKMIGNFVDRKMSDAPSPQRPVEAHEDKEEEDEAEKEDGLVDHADEESSDEAGDEGDEGDLNADVSDDEENEDYDAHGNLVYSVPPCDRVGLNDGMDGTYWLLSGELRPRRSSEKHTYSTDHMPNLGKRGTPVALTEEQIAARRAKAAMRQAEERAQREASLAVYLERIEFESRGFPIADALWLGSRHVIANPTWMIETDITRVLNVTTKKFAYRVTDRTLLKVKQMPLEDSGSQADALLAVLGTACETLDKWLNDGHRVMVHCQHGLSRSPSVLIAFLVARRNYTLQDAYDLVDGARRGLRINDGFLRALVKWERHCYPTLQRTTLKRYHRGGQGLMD